MLMCLYEMLNPKLLCVRAIGSVHVHNFPNARLHLCLTNHFGLSLAAKESHVQAKMYGFKKNGLLTCMAASMPAKRLESRIRIRLYQNVCISLSGQFIVISICRPKEQGAQAKLMMLWRGGKSLQHTRSEYDQTTYKTSMTPSSGLFCFDFWFGIFPFNFSSETISKSFVLFFWILPVFLYIGNIYV